MFFIIKITEKFMLKLFQVSALLSLGKKETLLFCLLPLLPHANLVKFSWQPVTSGVPQGSVWGQFCLISLSMILMRGSRAPSKFAANIKVGVGVDLPKGRRALQRDLVRLH